MDRVGGFTFQLLHATWYPHPGSYCGNNSNRRTSGLAYSETEFLWESEKYVISPSWWQMSHGVYKFSLILLSRQKPPSLLKWLTTSLQLPDVGLPPSLIAIGLLSFSASMTSSSRQDTAHLVFLRPTSRWGSAVVFWSLKPCSQAQLQHLPFHMVTQIFSKDSGNSIVAIHSKPYEKWKFCSSCRGGDS